MYLWKSSIISTCRFYKKILKFEHNTQQFFVSSWIMNSYILLKQITQLLHLSDNFLSSYIFLIPIILFIDATCWDNNTVSEPGSLEARLSSKQAKECVQSQSLVWVSALCDCCEARSVRFIFCFTLSYWTCLRSDFTDLTSCLELIKQELSMLQFFKLYNSDTQTSFIVNFTKNIVYNVN